MCDFAFSIIILSVCKNIMLTFCEQILLLQRVDRNIYWISDKLCLIRVSTLN